MGVFWGGLGVVSVLPLFRSAQGPESQFYERDCDAQQTQQASQAVKQASQSVSQSASKQHTNEEQR